MVVLDKMMGLYKAKTSNYGEEKFRRRKLRFFTVSQTFKFLQILEIFEFFCERFSKLRDFLQKKLIKRIDIRYI